ncbi:MAG: hypothetical protein AB7P02_28615 [Alphaproteobacteria bacterium]
MTTRITLIAAAAFAILAAAAPSSACDPETMSEQMAELCRSPMDLLSQAVADLTGRHDVAPLQAELARARFACNDGRYEDGLAIAMALARRVGRIEAGRPS